MCSWLVGCNDPGGIPGSYTFPKAMLSVAIEGPDHARAVRETVESFAKQELLRHVPLVDTPAYREKARSMRDTRYVPDPPNSVIGIDVTLFEVAPTCFVVEVNERSGAWTAKSVSSFGRLQRMLWQLRPDRVRIAYAPNELDNYPSQLTHSATFPSLVAACQQLKAGMGGRERFAAGRLPHVLPTSSAVTNASMLEIRRTGNAVLMTTGRHLQSTIHQPVESGQENSHV